MQHRVGLAGTIERRCGETLQPMIAKLQPGVLAGDIEMRRLAEIGQRMGNRTELDRFRTRSDNERNS